MLKAEIMQVQRSFAFRLSAFLFIPFCLRRGGTPLPYLASRIPCIRLFLIFQFFSYPITPSSALSIRNAFTVSASTANPGM
jgi:hypothetical protein